MRPPLALATQRIAVDERSGERRDALDQNWARFLAACGMLTAGAPNDPDRARDLWKALRPSVLILTGGDDLGIVGGSAPERDETERILLREALADETPVIGVCRGAQVIATYMGAELVRVDNHVGRHAVEGPGGGRIVNSFHNYGFVQPPYGVEVGARSADGVIESFTGRTTRVLAMMWHPERNVPFEAEDIRSIRGFLGIDACAD